MKIHGLALICVLALAIAANGLSAATWDGSAGDNLWTTAANWDTNDVPDTAGETAVFDTISPAGNAITIPAALGIDTIQVNTGRTITFTLAGAANLGATGVFAIDVQTGATATFTSGSMNTLNINNDIRVSGSGLLVFNANVSLQAVGPEQVDISVGDGSTFTCNGHFKANQNVVFTGNNTGGTTSITFNSIEVDGDYDLEFDIAGTGDVNMTVNGDIFGSDEDGAYFGMWNLLTGGNERYNVTMNGNFDANGIDSFDIEADYGYWTFPGASAFVLNGGSFTNFYFGLIDVPAGGSVTMPDGALFVPASEFVGVYQLAVDGTLDFGDNNLEFYGSVFGGDSTVIDIDAAATFSQTGDVAFYTNGSATSTIVGAVTFDGDVLFDGNSDAVVVVGLGGTVTFNGLATIAGSPFGADEDGSTTTATPATINYNGNVRVDLSGGLLAGEGVHNFAGDVLDLGSTAAVDFVIAEPDNDNDFLPEIHLTDTTIAGMYTQVINFSAGGSVFFVTSVVAETRILQSGTMHPAFLDLSAATGAGSVWDGVGANVSFGVAFGSEDNLSLFGTDTIRITTGALDVEFGGVLMAEVGSPANASDQAIVEFTSTGAGEFFFEDLTIEGDTSDDFGGAESNGGRVFFVDTALTITTVTPLWVEDGSGGGVGGKINFENSTLMTAVLNVGNGAAATDDEGAGAQFIESTLILEANGNVNVEDFCEFFFFDSTVGSDGTGDYNFWASAFSEIVVFLNSTMTGAAAFDINIILGSQELYLVNSLFEHYDAAGVAIENGSIVAALQGNTFQNGVNGGSHISLDGLGNATKLNCDLNLFDDSTGAGGDALITITAATTNRLNFRCLVGGDFGLGSVSISAVQAEAMDDDGATATDVTWEEVPNELAVAPALNQPAGLISDTTANQTLARFTLTATGVNSTITEMSFMFSGQGPLAGNLGSDDIASATLYVDADADGQFDSGEHLTGCLNIAVTNGSVTFTIAGEVVAVGTPETWSLAITFNGGAAGNYGTLSVYCLPVVGLIITNGATTIVSGLPLAIEDIPVSGVVASVVIITAPTATQEDTAITPAPVIELRDAAGNVVLGRAINVAVTIQSGGTAGAVLGGTTTVACNPATGRSTFGDLSIDLAGTGYILRFTASSIFADSAAFDITAAPVPPKKKGGGGGGCSAEGGATGWAAFAALLAAMSLGAVARLRRE